MPKTETTSDKFKADVLDLKVDRQLLYFDDANTARSMPFAAGDAFAHACWLGMIEHAKRSDTGGDHPFIYRMTDAGIARRKVLIAAQSDDLPVPPGSEIQFPGQTDPSLLDVTLRIEEERLRRMKRENDIAEGKLVPVEKVDAAVQARFDEALNLLNGLATPPRHDWGSQRG